MKELQTNLEKLAIAHKNVLLIGHHGVGKTTVAKQAFEAAGLKMKYFSSTIDPWAHLVGIPVPKAGKITFAKDNSLQEAEVLFFDEVNRASEVVRNMILEIVQFQTVNGDPLPNLKCVWAAINPPDGDYQVEGLDPALTDRFHAFFNVEAAPSIGYLAKHMPEKVAMELVSWWSTLNDEQKKAVPPRRLEYIGTVLASGCPLAAAMPPGVVLPIETLSTALEGKEVVAKPITREDVAKLYQPYIDGKLSQIVGEQQLAVDSARMEPILDALLAESDDSDLMIGEVLAANALRTPEATKAFFKPIHPYLLCYCWVITKDRIADPLCKKLWDVLEEIREEGDEDGPHEFIEVS